jgi:hypothetical protein
MCSHGGEPSGFQRNSYAKILAKRTVIEHQLRYELMRAKPCLKPDLDTGALQNLPPLPRYRRKDYLKGDLPAMILYASRLPGEGRKMSDDDDEHIVLNFQSRPKSRQANGANRPSNLKTTAPEDLVSGGTVIVALVLAVAMVSGWVPLDRYSAGILACLAALAAAAKLIRARRSKPPVTDFPRQRR